MLPALLTKWARTSLSGYIRYTFESSQTVAILLFAEGQLITAKTSTRAVVTSALEALTALAQHATSEEGEIDVYRLSPPLVAAVNGVLHGGYHVRGQELKATDVQGLAAKIKERKLLGCVRVYTATRCSLIFYRDGTGTGFFHDGSEVIETGATDEQRIANQPGAKMDVLSTPAPAQLQTYDLLEMLNLQRIWERAWSENQPRAEALHQRAAALERQRLDDVLASLEEALKGIAATSIGPLGRNLLTQELTNRGGKSCLTHPDQVAGLLATVEKGAKLVAGSAKVKALLQQLQAEIDTRLAGRS
jgi:hypothetical protein